MNKELIDRFVSYMDLLAPDLMSCGQFAGVSIHEETAVLEYSLSRRHQAGELLDEIDDINELVLLYHVVPDETAAVSGDRICAYSDLHTEYIFKVNAVCDGDKRCGTLYVTLYDSLETMGFQLLDEFRRQTAGNRVLYRRGEQKMLSDFLC